jgi:hypothetical protein
MNGAELVLIMYWQGKRETGVEQRLRDMRSRDGRPSDKRGATREGAQPHHGCEVTSQDDEGRQEVGEQEREQRLKDAPPEAQRVVLVETVEIVLNLRADSSIITFKRTAYCYLRVVHRYFSYQVPKVGARRLLSERVVLVETVKIVLNLRAAGTASSR